MAKASKIKLPREPTRKQRSRAQREAQQQRYLLIGVAAVLVVTIGLLLFGVFDQRVLQPRRPVGKVGTTEISTENFQKRVHYQYLNIVNSLNRLQQQRLEIGDDPQLSFFAEQIDQQITQLRDELENPALAGQQVLDAMIDEELIRQEAVRRGISVAPAEVTTFVEQDFFGFYRVPPTPVPTLPPPPTPNLPLTQTLEPTQTPVPSPTPMSEADYNAAYRDYTALLSRETGMTENDFRRLVENELLRHKLEEAFVGEVPPEAEQIKLRYVLFESEAAAKAGSALLSYGEAFDEFYADVEAGEVISTTGGESSWLLVEDLGQQLEQRVIDQLTTLSISQTTSLITTPFDSSYVYQVIDREARPLSDGQRQSKGQTAFETWLALKRVEPDLVDYLNDRYVDVTPPSKYRR